MAPRNLNQSSNDGAESVVFDNLDLDPAEFQTGQDDLSDGGDDDGSGFAGPSDLGDGGEPDPFAPIAPQERQLDDLRLSQTRQPPRKTGNQFDAKGNLVGADGRVIAKAGSEARLYVKAEKATQQANAAEGRIQEVNGRLQKAIEIGTGLNTQLEAYKARDAQLKEFGLDSNDQVNAFQLYQSLKRDTAGTIQKLLTRAAANGINVNGANNNGQIDPKGILDLVRQEIASGLKPLSEQTAAQKQQQEQQDRQRQDTERVQEEVQSFFRQNQEAVPYLPVFQKTLVDPRFKNMSLGEIWARIQLNLERNRSQRSPKTLRGGASIPNGRPAAPRRNDNVASVGSDYGEILNGILDEAGVSR